MENRAIKVNIKAVVEDLKNIQIENVIFEAIINAMQANATKIKLNIFSQNLFKDNREHKEKLYIDKMQVMDNGDGFNEANIESFYDYRSAYKRNLGCKGIGRFIYLVFFKNIQIISKNVQIDFSSENINKIYSKDYVKMTSVNFLKPFKNTFINFNNLENKIREHFLAYFKMNEKYIEIEVSINNQAEYIIKSNDTPKFENHNFEIKNYKFEISYLFGNTNFKNEGFYVANHRIVIKNSDLDSERKFNLPDEIPIYYILKSEYFDKNVNDERNELQIYPKQKDQLDFQDLNWNDIHDALNITIEKICLKHNFNIEETIQNNKKSAIEKYPYLGIYFENSKELNLSDMIKNAKKVFNDEKEFLRNKNNRKDKDYDIKLTKVTQAELAEYIFDRNNIIQQLEESIKNGDVESKIHNLFMKKHTTDEKKNYRANNVWLFDDRFMSYDKIFSEIQIKEIFPELIDNVDRPDIISIISNTNDKDKITDILLIEFKRPKEEITPAEAEEQLLRYGRYINNINLKNQIRIWAYSFLKFNDETIESLEDKSYNQIFTSNKYPICYKYHHARNMIINFMDYNSLVDDAKNRNQLFLKILRGEYLDD